ncbi:MAG: NADH-quinone oxidoreductase subunit A [Armatimonadetes bacterium]|nr:NADH-quinone oxidoreductase subunit A [Armatimonadota bacterium]
MEPNESIAWVALGVAGALALIIASALPFISSLLGPRRPSDVKLQSYECGITPEQEAMGPVSVRFGVTAMLFLLFDIEVVFLYPWAAAFGRMGLFAVFEALVFLAILAVGYLWVWKRGAFEWDK